MTRCVGGLLSYCMKINSIVKQTTSRKTAVVSTSIQQTLLKHGMHTLCLWVLQHPSVLRSDQHSKASVSNPSAPSLSAQLIQLVWEVRLGEERSESL